MKINFSKLRFILRIVGVFLILLSFILNPFVLAKLFSPDGILEHETVVKIVSFEAFLLILGVVIICVLRSDAVFKWIGKVVCIKSKKSKKSKNIAHTQLGRKLTNFLINLIIFILSSIIILILFESILRFMYPPVITTQYLLNPLLGSTLAPNQDTIWVGPEYKGKPEFISSIKTNSLGFRDEEHTLEKPNNTFRIAILGDSFVEALQVEYNQTFHQILENKLNENSKGIKFEVLLFGISGYGTANEYLALKNYALNYSPDLVIVAFLTGNDLRNNNPNIEYDNYYRPFFIFNGTDSLHLMYYIPQQKIISSGIIGKICKKLNLLSCDFFKKRITNAGLKINKERYYLDNFIYAIPYPREFEISWNITKILLLEMKNITEKDNATFFIISMTNINQLHPFDLYTMNKELNISYNWDIARPEKELSNFSKKSGITYFPLLYPFLDYVNKTGARLHYFTDGHWNAAGHALAAQVLYDYLIKNKLVPT